MAEVAGTVMSEIVVPVSRIRVSWEVDNSVVSARMPSAAAEERRGAGESLLRSMDAT